MVGVTLMMMARLFVFAVTLESGVCKLLVWLDCVMQLRLKGDVTSRTTKHTHCYFFRYRSIMIVVMRFFGGRIHSLIPRRVSRGKGECRVKVY